MYTAASLILSPGLRTLQTCDVEGETKHSSVAASKTPRAIAIEEFYSPDEYTERCYTIHQIYWMQPSRLASRMSSGG